MEFILLLVLFAGMVALSNGAKKSGMRTARQGHEAQTGADASGVPQHTPSRPMRPVDVDLPGQTTMPIHRHGSIEGEDSREGLSDYDMSIPYYYDEADGHIRQVERTDASSPRQPQAQGAKPVEIPGLDLKFDGNTLVKGMIFSEILARRPLHHMPGRRPS